MDDDDDHGSTAFNRRRGDANTAEPKQRKKPRQSAKATDPEPEPEPEAT